MQGHWLRGPLWTMAGGSAASAVGAVVLAIAIPHDAALVYAPQALGTSLLALGFATIALKLPHVAHADTAFAWLRRPANMLAGGYGLYAFGWCWLAVSFRDTRPSLLAGTAIGAFGAVLSAAAIWTGAKRLPQGPPVIAAPLKSANTASEPTSASRATRHIRLVGAAAPLMRAGMWFADLCVLFVALPCLILGPSDVRILGGFLLIAFVALTRFLYRSRPQRDGSRFDRMEA